MVGVEDFRHAMRSDRAGHGPYAEAGIERIRQFPSEDCPAVPVENGTQVEEAALDRDICDVARPDLVGPVNRQVPQQVREDRMGGMTTGEIRFPVNRFQPHLSHQPPHPLAIHRIALSAQPAGHLPRTKDRKHQIRLVNQLKYLR